MFSHLISKSSVFAAITLPLMAGSLDKLSLNGPDESQPGSQVSLDTYSIPVTFPNNSLQITDLLSLDYKRKSPNSFLGLGFVLDGLPSSDKVTYQVDRGVSYPIKADYGSGYVVFNYEDRQDVMQRFKKGAEEIMARRMSSIQFYIGSSLVRTYTLTYDSSPASVRSRLVSVKQCDQSGNCQNPLALKWADGNGQGWVSDSRYKFGPTISMIKPGYSQDNGVHFMDLNGDGLPDAVQNVLWANGKGGGSTTHGALINTNPGWRAAPEFDFGPTIMTNYGDKCSLDDGVRFIDFDGDGLTDAIQHVLWADGRGGGKTLAGALRNTGSGWENAPSYTPMEKISVNMGTCSHQDGGFLFGDLNGDELIDAVFSVLWNASTPNPTLISGAYLNTGKGWEVAPQFAPPVPIFVNRGVDTSQDNGVRQVDLNGDGLMDLVQHVFWPNDRSRSASGAWINTGKGWQDAASLGYSFVPPPTFVMNPGSFSQDNGVMFVDLNGDGLDDMVQHSLWPDGNSENKAAWFNTGIGWQAADPMWVPPPIMVINSDRDKQNSSQDNGVRFVDLNDDGLDDIIQHVFWPNDSRFGRQQGAWLNMGYSHGWQFAPVYTPGSTIVINPGRQVQDNGIRLIDVNGDGLEDIVQNVGAPNGGGASLAGTVLNQQGQADYLVSVSGG